MTHIPSSLSSRCGRVVWHLPIFPSARSSQMLRDVCLLIDGQENALAVSPLCSCVTGPNSLFSSMDLLQLLTLHEASGCGSNLKQLICAGRKRVEKGFCFPILFIGSCF